MRLLFCGDVVGSSGRAAIQKYIPELRQRLRLDFVVVNGENAAHGFGLTAKICAEFHELGVDVITTGNHVWDKKEIITYIDGDPRLLRPFNYPRGTPGRGAAVYDAPGGRKVLVAQVMGRLFMDPLDDPFAAVEALLSHYRLGDKVQAVILDIHGEASSEKMAMAHLADGRASMVVGSHTHTPTADAQILPGGTAYQTDAGMCGDYNSVIGVVKDPSIARFVTKMPTERLSPAEGEATLCGVYVETDEVTGLAKVVKPVRLGGRLAQAMPD